MLSRIAIAAALSALITDVAAVSAKDWSIPLAGNTFVTAPSPSDRGIDRNGRVRIRGSEKVFSAFFHVDKAATLDLKLSAMSLGEPAALEAIIGDQTFMISVPAEKHADLPIGKIEVKEAGYVQVDLKLQSADQDATVDVPSLGVESADESLELSFVRSNDGGMFYWGRRGPSVHLGYRVPKEKNIQFAYSEITVPEESDVIGSYFMANGFGEGYFGFQVNGPDTRKVLFSVWSPFSTDNPKDIPEDQRIVKLASGPGVKVGEFGNEGSGGQSFLDYPWVAGKTYRFLTEVKPDGDDHTIYTSWFGDKEANEWRLIASFKRPKTSTYYRGFHSFLENFLTSTGHIARGAEYGNQWVRDTDGNWYECTEAVLTADNTARSGQRVDYAGGGKGTVFFMRNCGFENTNGVVDQAYSRESTESDKPNIDFEKLPRE